MLKKYYWKLDCHLSFLCNMCKSWYSFTESCFSVIFMIKSAFDYLLHQFTELIECSTLNYSNEMLKFARITCFFALHGCCGLSLQQRHKLLYTSWVCVSGLITQLMSVSV